MTNEYAFSSFRRKKKKRLKLKIKQKEKQQEQQLSPSSEVHAQAQVPVVTSGCEHYDDVDKRLIDSIRNDQPSPKVTESIKSGVSSNVEEKNSAEIQKTLPESNNDSSNDSNNDEEHHQLQQVSPSEESKATIILPESKAEAPPTLSTPTILPILPIPATEASSSNQIDQVNTKLTDVYVTGSGFEEKDEKETLKKIELKNTPRLQQKKRTLSSSPSSEVLVDNDEGKAEGDVRYLIGSTATTLTTIKSRRETKSETDYTDQLTLESEDEERERKAEETSKNEKVLMEQESTRTVVHPFPTSNNEYPATVRNTSPIIFARSHGQPSTKSSKTKLKVSPPPSSSPSSLPPQSDVVVSLQSSFSDRNDDSGGSGEGEVVDDATTTISAGDFSNKRIMNSKKPWKEDIRTKNNNNAVDEDAVDEDDGDGDGDGDSEADADAILANNIAQNNNMRRVNSNRSLRTLSRSQSGSNRSMRPLSRSQSGSIRPMRTLSRNRSGSNRSMRTLSRSESGSIRSMRTLSRSRSGSNRSVRAITRNSQQRSRSFDSNRSIRSISRSESFDSKTSSTKMSDSGDESDCEFYDDIERDDDDDNENIEQHPDEIYEMYRRYLSSDKIDDDKNNNDTDCNHDNRNNQKQTKILKSGSAPLQYLDYSYRYSAAVEELNEAVDQLTKSNVISSPSPSPPVTISSSVSEGEGDQDNRTVPSCRGDRIVVADERNNLETKKHGEKNSTDMKHEIKDLDFDGIEDDKRIATVQRTKPEKYEKVENVRTSLVDQDPTPYTDSSFPSHQQGEREVKQQQQQQQQNLDKNSRYEFDKFPDDMTLNSEKETNHDEDDFSVVWKSIKNIDVPNNIVSPVSSTSMSRTSLRTSAHKCTFVTTKEMTIHENSISTLGTSQKTNHGMHGERGEHTSFELKKGGSLELCRDGQYLHRYRITSNSSSTLKGKDRRNIEESDKFSSKSLAESKIESFDAHDHAEIHPTRESKRSLQHKREINVCISDSTLPITNDLEQAITPRSNCECNSEVIANGKKKQNPATSSSDSLKKPSSSILARRNFTRGILNFLFFAILIFLFYFLVWFETMTDDNAPLEIKPIFPIDMKTQVPTNLRTISFPSPDKSSLRPIKQSHHHIKRPKPILDFCFGIWHAC